MLCISISKSCTSLVLDARLSTSYSPAVPAVQCLAALATAERVHFGKPVCTQELGLEVESSYV